MAKKKKYHLVQDGAHKRIVSDADFFCHGIHIKPGMKGGLVDDESNLSNDGTCWIGENATAYNKAKISGDCYVGGNVIVCGGAMIKDNAVVIDNCQISSGAIVRGNANISGAVCISGKIVIGRTMPCGIYMNHEGSLLADVVMSYSSNTGLFHVNNYVSKNNLNVVIKASDSDKNGMTYCQVVANTYKE